MAETVKDADEGGAAVDAEMEDGKKPEEESKKLSGQDDPEAKVFSEEKKKEGNETAGGEENPAVPAEKKDETDQPEATGAI